MWILAQIKAHRIMRVSFKFHSFVRFDGAPIISRYTHISKTEGGRGGGRTNETTALQPTRDRRSGIRNILSALINVNNRFRI